MANPFAKKPDDEDPNAPAKEKPVDAPAEAPVGGEKPATDKPAPAGEKPAGGDAKAKGNSAPETPGQGVPDVLPHPEPGAKAEPEESPQGKAALPDETDDAQAKEQPKGLSTLATMTKEQALKDSGPTQDPMAHITQLMGIVEGLANHVKGMGTAPNGVGGTSTMGAMGVAKSMPGKPGAQPMRPGMPKPGMPGMAAKPGMMGARPAIGAGAGIGGAGPAPGKMLTMEQITGLMGIIEAANTGRVPRAGAALLIAQGFGMDPQTAMAMVSPDAQAGGPGQALTSALGGDGQATEEAPLEETSLFDGPDALNPEEEETGDPEEELDPEEEEEDPAVAPAKKRAFGSTWDFKKFDAADQIDDARRRLEAERKKLDERIDAVERTIEVLGNPFA